MPPKVPTLFTQAAEGGGLGGVEDEGLGVRRVGRAVEVVVGPVVDDRVVDLGVRERGLDGRGGQLEADRDDERAALGDGGLEVRGVVVVVRGLELQRLDAELVSGAVHALLGRLVERLVVPTAGVGDEAGLEVGVDGGGSALGLVGRRLTAAGKSEDDTGGDRRAEQLLGGGDGHGCLPQRTRGHRGSIKVT